jgi:hypothetical protein
MADDTTVEDQGQGPGPGTGVKKGLPVQSLKTAEQAAQKLWEVARRGAVAPEAYAKQLGLTKASGGAWRAKLALLRGFGLVTVSKTDIRLSDLGLDIIRTDDDSKRQAARRKSFFKVRVYKELVDAYAGEELPERDQIASKLEFQFGRSAEAAQQAAGAFIESLKHAGLLDHSNTVLRSQHEAASNEAGSPIGGAADDSDEFAGEFEDAVDDDGDDLGEPVRQHQAAAEIEPVSDRLVSLTVTLDLSGFRAEEVLEILRALGIGRPAHGG